MEFSNIIASDIVGAGHNAFWDDISGQVKSLPVRAILILSSIYKDGSTEDVQLQKILQACKIGPEQYNILQVDDGQKIAWHKLRERLAPTTILLIGIHPLQLGISAIFKLNEVNHFNDCIFVPTLSLSELDKQPEMKKQLWNGALKPLFIDPL